MNRAQAQLVLTIFFIILFSLWAYPLQLFITLFMLGAGYFFITKFLIPRINDANTKSDRAIRRQYALRAAGIFLVPYKSIWHDLKLTNKYCYLKLGADGVTITGAEKNYPFRKFKVLSSHVHSYEDLWNMFCKNFSHNKTYEGLIEDCKLYELSVYEYSKPVEKEPPAQKIPLKPVEKLDINNCSEIELTELPGISIVMAKKVVKKRDEIGGFKSIDDFFLYMKLKSHMENQLKEKICVKKMKGSLKKVERNSERTVDL